MEPRLRKESGCADDGWGALRTALHTSLHGTDRDGGGDVGVVAARVTRDTLGNVYWFGSGDIVRVRGAGAGVSGGKGGGAADEETDRFRPSLLFAGDGSLNASRGQHPVLRIIVSAFGEMCCVQGDDGGGIMVVSMNSPLRRVRRFGLSSDADVVVCPSTRLVLPSLSWERGRPRGSPQQRQRARDFGEADGAPSVLDLAFHPDSSAHLCLLTNANEFHIYNVIADAAVPEQSFIFRGEEGGRPLEDLVSFCFPSATSLLVRGWSRFAILFVDVKGRIHSLCPVIPNGVKVVRYLLPSASLTAQRRGANGKEIGDAPAPTRCEDICRGYLETRFPAGLCRLGGANHRPTSSSMPGDDDAVAARPAVGGGNNILTSSPMSVATALAYAPVLYQLPAANYVNDYGDSDYSRVRRLHFSKVPSAAATSEQHGSQSEETGVGIVVSSSYYTGDVGIFLIFPDIMPAWRADDGIHEGDADENTGAQGSVYASGNTIVMEVRAADERSYRHCGDTAERMQELVLVDRKSLGTKSRGAGCNAGPLMEIEWNHTDNYRLLIVRDADVHVLTLSLMHTLKALGSHDGEYESFDDTDELGTDIRMPSCAVDCVYSTDDPRASSSVGGGVVGAVLTTEWIVSVMEGGEVMTSPLPAFDIGARVFEDDDAADLGFGDGVHSVQSMVDAIEDDDDTLKRLVSAFNEKMAANGSTAAPAPASSYLEFSPPPRHLSSPGNAGMATSRTPADSVEGQQMLAASLRDFRSKYLGYAHRIRAALQTRRDHQDGTKERNAAAIEALERRLENLRRGGSCATAEELRERVAALRDRHEANVSLLQKLKSAFDDHGGGAGVARAPRLGAHCTVGEKILLDNLNQLEEQIIPHLRRRIDEFSVPGADDDDSLGRQHSRGGRYVGARAHRDAGHISDMTMKKVRSALTANEAAIKSNIDIVEALRLEASPSVL